MGSRARRRSAAGSSGGVVRCPQREQCVALLDASEGADAVAFAANVTAVALAADWVASTHGDLSLLRSLESMAAFRARRDAGAARPAQAPVLAVLATPRAPQPLQLCPPAAPQLALAAPAPRLTPPQALQPAVVPGDQSGARAAPLPSAALGASREVAAACSGGTGCAVEVAGASREAASASPPAVAASSEAAPPRVRPLAADSASQELKSEATSPSRRGALRAAERAAPIEVAAAQREAAGVTATAAGASPAAATAPSAGAAASREAAPSPAVPSECAVC